MESTFIYKGFWIDYYSIGGTTCVRDNIGVIKSFPGYGMLDGEDAAKNFIDSIVD